MVKLSHHAYKRRKRLGLDKKSLARTAEMARQDGKPRISFGGSFRVYLDRYYLPYAEGGTELYIYHNNIYVFKGNKLITTWVIPSKYFRSRIKLLSNKEK